MLIVEACLLNLNGFLDFDPHKYLDVKYWTFQPLMLEETTAQQMVGACVSRKDPQMVRWPAVCPWRWSPWSLQPEWKQNVCCDPGMLLLGWEDCSLQQPSQELTEWLKSSLYLVLARGGWYWDPQYKHPRPDGYNDHGGQRLWKMWDLSS